jgi:ParB family chromosome partitioning protein
MTEPILKTIPVEKIVPSPYQPREKFSKDSLEELASSIQSTNVLQPIIVRPYKGGYQIACGERRWRAAQMAGHDELSAVVREMDDRTLQLYSIVENLHRLDLEAHEKEKAIHDLWARHYEKTGKTKADLAKDIGMSLQNVSRLIDVFEERDIIPGRETRRALTTSDFEVTRGLQKSLRKELLEKKAREEIGQTELEEIASVAKSAPPEKQRTIVEDVVRETKKAHELVKIAKEEAEEIAKGETKRIEIHLGADENRLRRFADSYKDIRTHLTVANIEMIKNETFRWKAVEILEKTREYCERVLAQLEKRKWYQK